MANPLGVTNQVLGAVTTVTNAASGLAGLILVTPQNVIGYQPQNTNGAGTNVTYTQPSILFNYEGENVAVLESDITDHFTENNTSVQDQIALKPVQITTQGFVGELNDIPPTKALLAIQQAAQKLVQIGAYVPGLSVTALNAYNEAVFAYETVNNTAKNAVSAWNSITGTTNGTTVINGLTEKTAPNQTQQQQYFQLFFGYWSSRTLFTIQTPWAIFQNMAIKSLRAIQSADTNTITDFEVTFKQILYAKILNQTALYSDNSYFQGQLQSQGASVVNTGTNALNPSPTSLSSVLGGIA